MEKEKSANDDDSSSHTASSKFGGAARPAAKSSGQAENINGESSENVKDSQNENSGSVEGTESTDENERDSDNDNDGLSDYEKLRLERIRRNQEYLSRLGLEEHQNKWKPIKRARKKKDESAKPKETTQQRKASLRRKTEQVCYSDIPIREILGQKTRPPISESQPRKRKPEKDIQHRMERFIYREFQRIQAERNTAQKQIDLLEKLVERKESRKQLSQTRRSELEAERAIFGGLTLRQLLKQIDQRFSELIEAAKDYDREMKEKSRSGKLDIEKRQKQLQIRRLCALDTYPVVFKNAASVLDTILYERFADLSMSQRRSNRSNTPVTVPPRQFPKIQFEMIPESPAKRFVEACGSYNGQKVAHHVGGWISPQYASIVDRSWPDRKDIYVPQVGDIVLYYPVGHQRFLEKHPDAIGENNATRIPLWKRTGTENGADRDWWNNCWLHSVDSGQGVYPLICRITETHFEFPPDDPFIPSVGADGSIGWKKKEKAALPKSHQNSLVRLAIALRPLSPVLPETLPLPPCFSVVWFPSNDAKPFLTLFQNAYTTYHSLSRGSLVKADKIHVAVQDFVQLNEKSTRLDQYFPSLLDLAQKSMLSISYILEKEMATLSREHRIAPHELSPIVDVIQKNLDMSNSHQRNEKLVSSDSETILSLIRLTLPLWEGVSCVPRSNKRAEMRLSPWEVQSRDIIFPVDAIESSIQELIEFVIDRTLREYSESDLFSEVLTDDDAPSYSCAVPIAMSTSVVLRKLRRHNYRSINSILNDVNAILGNCLLYNSPDAPIVTKARSFVVALQNNIIEAVAQSEKVHLSLGFSGIHSTFYMEDNAKCLYCKPVNVSPYRGSLERRWMYNGMVWAPQTGDVVIYSKKCHAAFVKFHSDDLPEMQCHTVEQLDDEAGEIEANVLWTKNCFPRQRRKHTPGTFHEDAPLIEVGLQFAKVATAVYWRPCTLSDAETLDCGCGCPSSFLRLTTNRALNAGLSHTDADNLALVFAALKQNCRGRTSHSMIDPKLSKKAVKEGYVPAMYPQISMDSVPFGTLSDLSYTEQLALFGFLPNSTNEGQQSTEPATLDYPLPELCPDLILFRIKKNYYRSRGALENDIIESFVNAVSTRLARLSKLEKSHVFLMNIALEFVQKHGVNKEEKQFMDVVQSVRELHTAALASAACIDCAVTLFGSTNHNTVQEICTTDASRDAARLSLATLLFTCCAENNHQDHVCWKDYHSSCKEIGVFRHRMVKLDGEPNTVKVLCEGRPFTYEFYLDEMDENNNMEPPNDVGDIKSVEVNCISFSMDELETYSHASQFFFGRPRKRHACARCQAKGRSFLDCRVLRKHSNIDFDWKAAFHAFGGIDGLMGSLFPDRKEVTDVQHGEHCDITVTEESNAESLASLRTIYQKCKEVLEQVTAMGTEIHCLSNLPIRLSKQFLEESFPVDPTDGRYIYCVICGISGDLFCCDTCPNVFHTRCLGLENVPAGEWFCEECNLTKKGGYIKLPFGRSEFDPRQLDQLDVKVNSLRSIRADRIRRQGSNNAKRKDRDQDDDENDAAPETESKLIDTVSHFERKRRECMSPQLDPVITVQDLPRRRGRPRKIELTDKNKNTPRQEEQSSHKPTSEDEHESNSVDKVANGRSRSRKSCMPRELHRTCPTTQDLPRRRGRPRKAEQMEKLKRITLQHPHISEKSNKARSQHINKSTAPQIIQALHQRKRGRPSKHSRVTEPYPKRSRKYSANTSDESASIKIPTRKGRGRISNNEGESQIECHSTSNVDEPVYPQPHRFVEDLAIENDTVMGEKIAALARKSARLSK